VQVLAQGMMQAVQRAITTPLLEATMSTALGSTLPEQKV